MKKLIYILIACCSVFCLASCNGTWLMYDTAQKDRLYFTVAPVPFDESFALTEDTEMSYTIPVNLVGMPADEDREFLVELFDTPKGETVKVGDTEVPVVNAVLGEDFTMSKCVVPAGQVSTEIQLTLKRTEKMKTNYASINLRIVEDDNFKPMDQDSTETHEIVSREYRLYVSDGEPVCPIWWKIDNKGTILDWYMYLGSYYPEKYRKLLDFYHEMENKNRRLYEQLVEVYGENLEKATTTGFFAQDNPTVWATYVLIPVYDYYVKYYAEHPDDPRVEVFKSSGTAGTYWRNPLSLLR